MTETRELSDVADLICNLKATVNALECQHKMNLLEEQAFRSKERKSQSSPPMFMMVPIEKKGHSDDSSIHKNKTRQKRMKSHHDRDSDTYSDSIACTDNRRISDRRRDECEDNYGPKLRGGVLLNRCGCIYRDGLQDDCPLTECQGRPACLTKPWATCRPGEYYRSQFPEIWPSPAIDAKIFNPCDL